MDKSLEELRLLIASCAESGQISKSDMEMLTVRARIMGLSPEELDALIQTSGQKSVDGMESMDGNFFHSQFFHEFFQPWHSAAVRELFSDYLSYVTIFGFFLLFLPIYICLIRKINQKLLKI
jgi:hypothetical protein